MRRIVLRDPLAPFLVGQAEDARRERIDLVLGQKRRQVCGFLLRQKLLIRVSRGPLREE